MHYELNRLRQKVQEGRTNLQVLLTLKIES